MIKLPELSSTHNVVTESAYDILSSNIDNLYTTLGVVTDYVSAAQQQGEIAAISAANVAVSSMSVVGSHLDTILSTENTIKEISSNLVNSTNIINEYDTRLQTTEDTLGRYLEYSQNILKNFETFDINTALTSDNVGTVSSRYYTDAPWTIRAAGIRTGGIVTSYKFSETSEIPPCSGATRYININTLSATDRLWISQSGCPALSESMIVSIYARGTGTGTLYANNGWSSNFTVTPTWKRYTYAIAKYNASIMGNPAGISFQAQKNSNIDFCGFQFEIGTIATTYNPISNNGFPSNNLIAVNCDVKHVITTSITTGSLVTNTAPVQLVNPNDTSDYPMTWIPQPKCQAVGRVAGVNGSSNVLYQCDQWYHYFRTGKNLCYIYDHNCKFVNKIESPNYEIWAHDTLKYQSTVVTNRNNKTLLVSDTGYNNYKMIYNIYDLNTAQLLTQVKFFDTNSVKGNPDCYAIHNVYGGNLSVNDITNNFIIFTKLYHHVETVNEDGTTTITNTSLGNGYLSLTEDGYFTKYNPDTQEWILSTEITPEIFTFVENAKASLHWSASLGSVIAFRNTIRGSITNPLLQCVTWVTIITETADLDGVFAFNEYDQLIPIRYTANTTGIGFDSNGVLPMNNATYTTKVTSPYSKNIYTVNKCYCLVAGSQPDTLNATNALVCDLVHGQGIYRLTKNTSTGELTISRLSTTSINNCGYAFPGNSPTLNGVALVGADGGSYGGRGNILYTDNNSYIIPTNMPSRLPIKLLGTKCEITRSIGLRSCRLQTTYPSNFHAVNCYASTWRGALHLEL